METAYGRARLEHADLRITGKIVSQGDPSINQNVGGSASGNGG